MESFTIEEMAEKVLEKVTYYRAIIDDLKTQYDKNKFTDYVIEEIDDGYILKKSDLTYIFEGKKTSPHNVKLTFIQQSCNIIYFTESEVLWESNDCEGLKSGIGEFFIRIGALL